MYQLITLVYWRCSTGDDGAWSVVMDGILETPMLHADRWDINGKTGFS